jgi:hypothetical protein
MRKRIKFTEKYGKLVIIEYVPSLRTTSGRSRGKSALCQCDCGKTKISLIYNLKSGRDTHCGCSHRGKPHVKYGITFGKREDFYI